MRPTSTQSSLPSQKASDTSRALLFRDFVDAVCATYGIEKHAAVRCVPARSRARVLYARNAADRSALPPAFERDGNTVLGKHVGDALAHLSADDIGLCKEAGFAFRLPENLDSGEQPAAHAAFRRPEFDSDSESEQ